MEDGNGEGLYVGWRWVLVDIRDHLSGETKFDLPQLVIPGFIIPHGGGKLSVLPEVLFDT